MARSGCPFRSGLPPKLGALGPTATAPPAGSGPSRPSLKSDGAPWLPRAAPAFGAAARCKQSLCQAEDGRARRRRRLLVPAAGAAPTKPRLEGPRDFEGPREAKEGACGRRGPAGLGSGVPAALGAPGWRERAELGGGGGRAGGSGVSGGPRCCRRTGGQAFTPFGRAARSCDLPATVPRAWRKRRRRSRGAPWCRPERRPPRRGLIGGPQHRRRTVGSASRQGHLQPAGGRAA